MQQLHFCALQYAYRWSFVQTSYSLKTAALDGVLIARRSVKSAFVADSVLEFSYTSASLSTPSNRSRSASVLTAPAASRNLEAFEAQLLIKLFKEANTARKKKEAETGV